jgi:hypothetical protein
MLGSEYPQNVDTYAVPGQPPLAASMFAQVMSIIENTQRSAGQGLGDLTAIGNLTDTTFGSQFKRLLRVDFGIETFISTSGTLITAANQGTVKINVSFNTYGGSTVFDTAADIRVFVTEAGGQVNAKTQPQINGNRKDSGDIVDGSVTTSGFSWRHDQTNAIGSVLWLAVQWAE